MKRNRIDARSLLRPRTACFLALCFIPLLSAADSTDATNLAATPAGQLSDAIDRFVDSLDPEQRETAVYAFEDNERFDLRLAPLGLEGLRIDEMSEGQWATLHRALGTFLSPEGLAKADTIRSLEREVAATEGGLFGWLFDRIRNPKRYFLSLYRTEETTTGHPREADSPWGLRFDGHHLSLNVTSAPGTPLSATPLFFGAQPREVPAHLERAGLRVLKEEEDRAIALILLLSDKQRAEARIPFIEGTQIRRPGFVGDSPRLELEAPKGIAFRDLNHDQRAQFDRLLDVHLRNFIEPLADRYRNMFKSQLGSLHFAYGVPEATQEAKAGQPLYYRIQSDGLLIEFDDTPEEANHVHVVIRSSQGDFGRDALTHHYEATH